METVKYTIIEDYGKLNSNGDIYFRFIEWNGYNKYDIRKWDTNGVVPFKGITIDPDEIDVFYDLIIKAQNSQKSSSPKYSVCLGNATANILDCFGSFSERYEMAKQVCFVKWGRAAKYDIRPWNKEYTVCGKGVTLNESQLQRLIEIISELFLF